MTLHLRTPCTSPSTQSYFEQTLSNNAPFDEAQDYNNAGKLIKHIRQGNDPNRYKETIDKLWNLLHATDVTQNELPKIVQQHDGTLNLKRMARDITSIVLPGGGAKGIAYVALMKELGQGLFPHVKQFIGSSAGSLAAIFMSFGEKPERTQEMLAEEFPKLFYTREDLRQVYPSLHFRDTMPLLARAFLWISGGKPPGEANEFVRKLDEVSSKATSDFLNSLSGKKLEEYVVRYCEKRPEETSLKDKILKRLTTLQEPADFSQNRETGMITFSDIDFLHSINPERFKDVQVTGFDIASRKVKYFNVAETPDMPLAYAARASMSHPLLATGVYFDKNLDKTGNVYIDGGIASNIPSEAVYGNNLEHAMGEKSSKENEEVRAKTIVMKFDESYTFKKERTEAKAYQRKNIFKRFLSSIVKYLRNWFINLVSHNPRAETHLKNDNKKFHAAKQNGYILYHGDLRTTEMNVSSERQQCAIDEASIGLLSQALKKREQGYLLPVEAIKEAYDHLTENEKERMLRTAYPIHMLFNIDQAKKKRDVLQKRCEALKNSKEATDEQRREAQEQLKTAQKTLEQLETGFEKTAELYKFVRENAPNQDQNSALLVDRQASTTLPAPHPIPVDENSLVAGGSLSLEAPKVGDELEAAAAVPLNKNPLGTIHSPSPLNIPSEGDGGTIISEVLIIDPKDDFTYEEA